MSNNYTKFTLFELNKLIKETIEKSLPETYWVIAEISEINEHSSGHCYLELIQKDETSDAVKARARANIWSYTYRMLKPYFETMANRPLSRGMKILVNAQIVFHELYGYSLNILDIEPSYTLGDIELKRRETIEKLTADGILDMNKELELELIPKRIAIISSSNAAGLQDFINQLTNNSYGYSFEYEVFQSTMQGDDAEKSIIESLSKIYDKIDCFDAIAMVRGGGAQADLSCFDSYLLASNIAQFPLPVITGIGHDKDVSVADMVAHTSVKTPTAVAEFLISKFIQAETIASELTNQLINITNQITKIENDQLSNLQLKFQYSSSNVIYNNTRKIESISKSLPFLSRLVIENSFKTIQSNQTRILLTTNSIINKNTTRIKSNNIKIQSFLPQKFIGERLKINHIEQIVHNLNPETLLQKGYSITYYNGKILKDYTKVNENSEVKIKLKKGTVFGNITRKEA
ncbi:MAG: exodeoxyribonuclease VII large subunit [Bacteroidales bacterium]